MNCSNCVNSVLSVSCWSVVALAMPKSITFGTGTPSCSVTRMFDGLMSRWMMPFWCACWMAWQTWMNSSSRSAVVRLFWSQYSVILMPRTSSMTKYGRPVSVAPASRTLAMFGWSISASAWRSASNRAMTLLRVHAQLDDLEGDAPPDRLLLLGHVNHAAAAFADLLQQLVTADAVAGLFGDGKIEKNCPLGRRHGRLLQKSASLFVRLQQPFHALAQIAVAAARLVEIRRAFAGWQLQRAGENGLFAIVRLAHGTRLASFLSERRRKGKRKERGTKVQRSSVSRKHLCCRHSADGSGGFGSRVMFLGGSTVPVGTNVPQVLPDSGL